MCVGRDTKNLKLSLLQHDFQTKNMKLEHVLTHTIPSVVTFMHTALAAVLNCPVHQSGFPPNLNHFSFLHYQQLYGIMVFVQVLQFHLISCATTFIGHFTL